MKFIFWRQKTTTVASLGNLPVNFHALVDDCGIIYLLFVRVVSQKIVVHVGGLPTLSLPDPIDCCQGESLKVDLGPAQQGNLSLMHFSASHLNPTPLFFQGGPWEFMYTFRNKTMVKKSSSPQYGFVAEEAGQMEFTWVANQYCNVTSDAYYNIRPLPTGRVMNGRDIKAVLIEGDSVNIMLDLYGEPPCMQQFLTSFRIPNIGAHSPPPPLSSLPPVNVTLQKTHFFDDTVETYELKGITNRQYSLPAHEEGEYFITYVGDKFCRSYRDPNIKR